MRRVLGFCAAIAGILAVAGTSSARPVIWQGSLSTKIAELGEIAITGGGVATVNGSSAVFPHLTTLRIKGSRGNLSGTNTIIITDPNAAPTVRRIIVDASLGTGTFRPFSGNSTANDDSLTMNVLPVRGLAKVCVLSTVCTNFVPLVLTVGGTRGVGIGGLITGMAHVLSANVRISIEAAPWTIKTATVVDQTDDNTGAAAFQVVTRRGFAHGPASHTSSTANQSGVVQLVTPAQVRTTITQGTNEKVGVIATLLIHFIPEPGLLLLLGSGVVGLAVLGRSRMRR
jgi:hypothetical protein